MNQRRDDLRFSNAPGGFELSGGEATFLRDALRAGQAAPDQVRTLLLLCEASAREGRPLDPCGLLVERFAQPGQRAQLAARLATSRVGRRGSTAPSSAAVERARLAHGDALPPAAARAWSAIQGELVPPTHSGSRVLLPPPSSASDSRGSRPRSGATPLPATHSGSHGFPQHPPSASDSRRAVPQSGDGPPARIGDYVVQRELGRGGMGVVYLARDLGLERDVAIKVCTGLAELEPTRRERRDARFRREAQAVARLRHPGIVSVYACGVHEGAPYLVMDYVAGETLQTVGRRGVRPDQAAAWTRELAEALAHAHAQGILHRDVKPENVMVDPRGHVHLMDFGLAHDALNDTGLTQSGALLGTAHYLSPEQAAGGDVDARTDVYSLGAVLYFLLGRRPPYAGHNWLVFLQELSSRDPVSLRELAPAAPQALVAVVERCMRRDREQRFASAEALAQALRASGAPGGQPGARPTLLPLYLGAGLCALALGVSFAAWGLTPARTEASAPPASEATTEVAWERFRDLARDPDPELAAELEGALPDASEAARRRGAALLEGHHPAASRRLWVALLEATPGDAQAIWALHRLDVQESGETHRATPGLERLRERGREGFKAFARALEAGHRGALDEAQARYDEALALAPDLAWLPAFNLAERAAYAVLTEASARPVERERALFEARAEAAREAGLPRALGARLDAWRRLLAKDLSGALEAVDACPGSWAELCRGWAHYYRTELDAAERAAEASLAADPALYEAHSFMSMLDGRRGRAAAALAHIERMISLRGVEPHTLLNRSALRAAVGDLAGCVADCQEILRQDERSVVARLNLGKAYHGLGRDEDAAAHLDFLVDLLDDQTGPLAAQALYERAAVREALQDAPAAVADLEAARARDPYGRLVPLIDQALARLGAPR